MKNFESQIPKPTPEDIESIIGHSKEPQEESLDLSNLSTEQLDELIIDSADLKSSDAIINPPGFFERINELKDKDFSEASNWTELYAIVASKGGIVMGGQNKTAKEVLGLIDQVRSGKLEPDVITRTGGLRAKVIELMES